MSGHKYVTNPNNLFEDEDVDDETFLKNSRPKQSTNPFEEQKQSFEEKRKEIEARTLQSTQKSLGLLHETEEVGKATALELGKQREQLEATSHRLHNIGANLQQSHKHLENIKSLFGGFKNYLAGTRGIRSVTPTSTPSKVTENGVKTESPPPVSTDEIFNSHPVNRLRNDLGSPTQKQEPSGPFEQRLEQNLEEMCGSLSRLKGLAVDLNKEIESQNDLLDNMTDTMENVDIKINKQNRDMNRLLGKK